MKAAEAKTPVTTSRSSTPFFGRENGESFFGKKAESDSFFQVAPFLQTKLTVGRPGDKYEQEADAMADQVVQRLSNPETVQAKPDSPVKAIAPLLQTKCAACEEEDKLQMQEDEEDQLKDKLQKKPIFDSAADSPEEMLQRKCAACEKESLLQKKGSNHTTQTAPAPVESSLASTKGSGSPLTTKTRRQMESSFGADFSQVRIHSDRAAVQMSNELNAQAFTHGSDIYFNNGKYSPTSKDGQHLLAHELTHTLQQGASVN